MGKLKEIEAKIQNNKLGAPSSDHKAKDIYWENKRQEEQTRQRALDAEKEERNHGGVVNVPFEYKPKKSSKPKTAAVAKKPAPKHER